MEEDKNLRELVELKEMTNKNNEYEFNSIKINIDVLNKTLAKLTNRKYRKWLNECINRCVYDSKQDNTWKGTFNSTYIDGYCVEIHPGYNSYRLAVVKLDEYEYCCFCFTQPKVYYQIRLDSIYHCIDEIALLCAHGINFKYSDTEPEINAQER